MISHMKNQKILTILRHAKTETGSASQDDRERALTERGIEAARAMGEYIARAGLLPQRVLCSTAMRARQSLEAMNLISPEERIFSVQFTDKLYLASANETLNLLAQTPEEVSSLMLIGHNPGLHQLCTKLAVSGDEAQLDTLAVKFPTCALAVIALEGPWHQLGQVRGHLLQFMTPKILVGMEE